MKFALCSEVYKTPIADTIRRIAEIGFDGIEIAPFNVAPDVNEVDAGGREAIRRLCEERGIDVVGLHWLLVSPGGLHMTAPDPSVRGRTYRYLQDLAQFCGDIGGKVMVLGSPKQRSIEPGIDPAAARGWVIEGLRDVAEVASQMRVRVLIEPLTPVETNFINTVDEAVRLAREIDHPQIGYHIDVKAMSAMPDGIEGTIRRFGQGAGHFHANEPGGKGPGMGSLEFGPIFRALRESGYLGWASAEPFDYAPGPDAVAEAALRAMRGAAEAAEKASKISTKSS